MKILLGKKILLGITGGIAAYKCCELIRLFQKAGAIVKVVMTNNATQFITPLTLEALSGNNVLVDMFNNHSNNIDHIDCARWSDLFIIAPASANTIAKIANGIADNLLTTIVLATSSPILVSPAMNTVMYKNIATQNNIQKIKNHNIEVFGPALGYQACGEIGEGRMEEPSAIFRKSVEMLLNKKSTKKIVITAGPTEEPLDPVRCITNRSSGKMGYALAQAAAIKGWDVTLISGPTTLEKPFGVNLIKVKTASEMMDASWNSCKSANCFIGCAAVSDFRPIKVAPNKIKKNPNDDTIKLVLTKNPDIIASIASIDQLYTVGFAAETEMLLEYARNKLKTKKLDMIIANDVSNQNIGFNSNNNEVTLITKEGNEKVLPLMSKEDLAIIIIEEIENNIKD